MADIRAFRAIRYDLGRVGALSQVVAPPYDVIDSTLQQRLYEASPFNAVRLEYNREEPGDLPGADRYSRAAGFLRDWLAEGILTQDSARSLYVCHQEYTVEGRTHVRKGFFARVRLEPFGTGNIFPHEQTLSGPKADRLALYRATGMNLSPVFGLYPDDTSEVMAELDRATARALPIEATDHLGVISRIWPITDTHQVSTVAGMMSARPIFIADGHHRYETGLRYREERLAAGDTSPEHPSNFVLMMLVGMSDPGLQILPTHRLVSGLSGITAGAVREALSEAFRVEATASTAAEAWQWLEADGSQSVLAFGSTADGIWQVFRLVDRAAMDRLTASQSPAWRELAVSILHVLALNDRLVPGRSMPPTCRYVHLLSEVESAQRAKDCDLAVLVPPATMAHVTAIAGNRETMPPKSTYFYPKLLTGLVFNSLRKD